MRYADHIVLFSQGRIAADGPTGEILTEARVEDLFGVTCRIVALPGEEARVLVPMPKATHRMRGSVRGPLDPTAPTAF